MLPVVICHLERASEMGTRFVAEHDQQWRPVFVDKLLPAKHTLEDMAAWGALPDPSVQASTAAVLVPLCRQPWSTWRNRYHSGSLSFVSSRNDLSPRNPTPWPLRTSRSMHNHTMYHYAHVWLQDAR